VTQLIFNVAGNLEPGIYSVVWVELVKIFGTSESRMRLLAGLQRAAQSLRQAGCDVLYVDGSFVTQKEASFGAPPNDFDGCWDLSNVDPTKLDPVLLDFSNKRAAQKAKFFGELFPAGSPADNKGTAFLDFFQQDKNTGEPKGIIALDLSSLP
jgi:hypothetical protein